MIPVILCGGSGTRLWPLSRAQYPKQFIPLLGERSLFQETMLSLEKFYTKKSIVMGSIKHRFPIIQQLEEAAIAHKPEIILEPVSRNTAPAIALAALYACSQESDPILFILTADHIIGDRKALWDAVTAALPCADDGALVTFGIAAKTPETGYGYIHLGETSYDKKTIHQIKEFVEKPDLLTAQSYIDSGEYAWNSGMFLFKASSYLEQLKIHRPDILDACTQAFAAARRDKNFIFIDEQKFTACPEDSIDYAVMEKINHAMVAELDVDWMDLGSWAALWDKAGHDAQGNAINGDVLAEDIQDCYIRSEERLVAAVGLKNVVIVETQDAVLVANRHEAQSIRQLSQRLKTAAREEFYAHREVYRPWGKYDLIDKGERYQVKHITVKPGEKLSVQMHHHRSEHWVVVSGTAKILRGEKEILLTENQSTYIPTGAVHALENPGKIPLELIEVQSGSYLGEDDIVRFEDRYGRETEPQKESD